MADYPSIDYTIQSDVLAQGGHATERTDGGALKSRSLWSAVKRQWNLEHVVNSTDAAAILAHHAAHLSATFGFTDAGDSTAYTVAYADDPRVSYLGGDMRRIRVTLEEA